MITFLLLLLIPVFSIIICMYIMTLITFIVNNEFDILMIILSFFTSIISIYIILKLLIHEKIANAFLLNLEPKFNTVIGLFSYVLLFLLGLASIINCFIHGINYFYFASGILLVILFIYALTEYFMKNESVIFKLDYIEKVNKKTNLLYFSNNDKKYEFYANSNIKYNKNKEYLCAFNKSSSNINKIIKEVVNEKNTKKSKKKC